MEFRRATIKDVPKMTDIRIKMREEREQLSSENRKILAENTKKFFEKNIENGLFVAYLCLEDNEIIATAGMTLFEMPPTTKLINGKVGKIMNMYTQPSFRKNGIANKLLKKLVDYANENGYYKIMLNSSAMGEPLYKKFGFTLINNEYKYYCK